MRRLLSGIPRPRFRVRTLLVLVALSAVALWGAKIVQDGPSTRWQILKFRHGSPATRREILDELHTQSVRGWFGGLFGLDNGNHLTGEAKKVEGRRRAALWIPALFEATEDADPRVRAAAIRTLAMVVYLHGTASEKNAALQRVIRATADRDAVIREHAVHSLIDFTMESPTKVLPVLREALHDPVMPVRRQAVEGLRFVGIVHDAMRAEMASELARILGGRDHPEIRAKAAWGLGLFVATIGTRPGRSSKRCRR